MDKTEYRWKKPISKEKVNNVIEYIKNHLNKNDDYEHKIFVGCDSSEKKFKGEIRSIYSTVIVMYRYGKGGHYLYSNDINGIKRKNKTGSSTSFLFMRLWGEVERVIDVVRFLEENGIDKISNVKEIEGNFDFNELDKNKSNMITSSALGYASSLNLKAEVKPNAFAASYVADRHCSKRKS